MSKTIRPTKHINRRLSQSIFRAFDYAQWVGRPLNTYVVLNFRETAERSAATAFFQVRHKFRDWLAYASKRFALGQQTADYVYTFENDSGLIHANWVIHVPPALMAEFDKKVRRWLKKSQGACGDFDISIQRVEPQRAKRLAKYILKGTDPQFVAHFFLQDVAKDQGLVVGKRAGISLSAGPSARKAAGFKRRYGRLDAFKYQIATNA